MAQRGQLLDIFYPEARLKWNSFTINKRIKWNYVTLSYSIPITKIKDN